jgi:hypothetical protein
MNNTEEAQSLDPHDEEIKSIHDKHDQGYCFLANREEETEGKGSIFLGVRPLLTG